MLNATDSACRDNHSVLSPDPRFQHPPSLETRIGDFALRQIDSRRLRCLCGLLPWRPEDQSRALTLKGMCKKPLCRSIELVCDLVVWSFESTAAWKLLRKIEKQRIERRDCCRYIDETLLKLRAQIICLSHESSVETCRIPNGKERCALTIAETNAP
jgi:hypothetical protein